MKIIDGILAKLLAVAPEGLVTTYNFFPRVSRLLSTRGFRALMVDRVLAGVDVTQVCQLEHRIRHIVGFIDICKRAGSNIVDSLLETLVVA